MQNSPEATCDCCTWDVVLTRVLSTSCYIYSPRCHLLERIRVSSVLSRPLSPFLDRSSPSDDRPPFLLLLLFLFFSSFSSPRSKTRTIRPRSFTARSFTVLTSVPFLSSFPFFSRSPGNFPTSSDDDNRQQPGWRRWTDVDGQTIHKYIDRR